MITNPSFGVWHGDNYEKYASPSNTHYTPTTNEEPYGIHRADCPGCGKQILAQFKVCDTCSPKLDALRRAHGLI
jgi:hypothetical protein